LALVITIQGRSAPLKRDWLDGVAVAPGEVVLLENVRFDFRAPRSLLG
jgi:3-phosphoglycerate kinase